jgi:hypothetical protein
MVFINYFFSPVILYILFVILSTIYDFLHSCGRGFCGQRPPPPWQLTPFFLFYSIFPTASSHALKATRRILMFRFVSLFYGRIPETLQPLFPRWKIPHFDNSNYSIFCFYFRPRLSRRLGGLSLSAFHNFGTFPFLAPYNFLPLFLAALLIISDFDYFS